jgi:hypothetical protein
MRLFKQAGFCAMAALAAFLMLAPQAAPAASSKKAAKTSVDKAAEAAAKKAEREAAKKAAEEEAKRAAEIAARPPFAKSLLFTELELDTIRKTEEGRAVQSTAKLESVELIPVDRKIWLQGIFYRAANDWIIWLNGYKLTPYYMLPEIRGIRVDRDRVHLEWYDIGKNGIINITLQPHQVYDIVTGILVWDTDGGAPAGKGKGRRASSPRRTR